MQVTDKRIRPVTGLVPAQNAKGKPFRPLDLMRLVRLNRTVYKTDKIDILAGKTQVDRLPDVLEYARDLDATITLRTDAVSPPANLEALKDEGLAGVFLCPRELSQLQLDAWHEVSGRLELSMRLQLQPPFPLDPDIDVLADRIASAGVNVVNVALADPFQAPYRCKDGAESRRTLDQIAALVRALDARDIEANLLGVPFCMVDEDIRPFTLNAAQFFRDHQQYHKLSYDLAQMLHARGPVVAGKILLVLLAQYTHWRNPVDTKLYPWLVFKPWLNVRMAFLRRLTRHMRVLRSTPRALEDTAEMYAKMLADSQEKIRRHVPENCSGCSLHRICDRESKALSETLPGIPVAPVPGEPVLNPHHFCGLRRKYYDAIDNARLEADERTRTLAEKAVSIVTHDAPDREVESFDHAIEGQWTHQMPGANRWHSMTNTEKLSTPLAYTAPPLTLSVTFGGGMADYIGFSFGRHCKIVCPMIEFSHRLVLHVDADGSYVLLRDGKPVEPVSFEGTHYAPVRLADFLVPRISIWNIDVEIVTQTVLVWEGARAEAEKAEQVKYSILMVCTRYARRLATTLRTVAHQEGIDLSKIEVVIAYVPGIDATEDVIDSMKLTYPGLRIVRSPFAEEHALSKGFLLNESAMLTSGKWIVLMDSDTLLAPNMFAEIEKIEADCTFIAPDGRVLLTREMTAKILMGEVEPWRQWNELLKGGGEFRLREAMGVPIGFFQCVRAECIQEIPVEELDHFEGADWRFGAAVRARFGREHRLTGVPVLHLDHEGSQWYGTKKQF